MKDFFKGLGIALIAIVVMLFLYAFTASGTLLVQKYIYPQWLSVQRLSVESSKSYTDSRNSAMMNFIKEYKALDTKIAEAKDDQAVITAYKGQQGAIMGQICQMFTTMKSDTISPIILQFVSTNGGCY